MSPRLSPLLVFVTGTILLAGCGPVRTQHHISSDPVRVEPIEVNINVRVKVERELDDFFDELDAKDETIQKTEEDSP